MHANPAFADHLHVVPGVRTQRQLGKLGVRSTPSRSAAPAARAAPFPLAAARFPKRPHAHPLPRRILQHITEPPYAEYAD